MVEPYFLKSHIYYFILKASDLVTKLLDSKSKYLPETKQKNICLNVKKINYSVCQRFYFSDNLFFIRQ